MYIMYFVINYNRGRMVVLFRGDSVSAINYYNRNTGCSIKVIERGLNKYKYFEHKCLYILNPNDLKLPYSINPLNIIDRKIGEIYDFIKIENRNIIINNIIYK